MIERLFTNRRLISEYDEVKDDVFTLNYEINSKWYSPEQKQNAKDDLKLLLVKYNKLRNEMIRRGYEA